VLPESGPLYTWSQGQCSTQINHSIGAKVEISPKGFTLAVKAELQKKNFNMPEVTDKCWTLYPCIGPKAGKGIPSSLQRQLMFQ
jgi:hypothetical protein